MHSRWEVGRAEWMDLSHAQSQAAVCPSVLACQKQGPVLIPVGLEQMRI
jgi:hypothetical protein